MRGRVASVVFWTATAAGFAAALTGALSLLLAAVLIPADAGHASDYGLALSPAQNVWVAMGVAGRLVLVVAVASAGLGLVACAAVRVGRPAVAHDLPLGQGGADGGR
mgnify:CR=1 FL=1